MKPARPTLSTIAAAAFVIGLAACGGSSSGGSSTPTGTPAAEATTSQAQAASNASAAATETSTSTSKAAHAGSVVIRDREHLLYVLEAVDPGMGTDESHLITQTEAMCNQISAGTDETTLEAHATKAFANGSFAPSELEAQAIVGTVKAYAC